MIVTPEGLTPAEVADALHVDASTVRLWIKNSRLRAYRIGGRWRVSHEELRRFVESGQPTTEAVA